jgi:glycosyltransferase involved in cell wall biosynthesis
MCSLAGHAHSCSPFDWPEPFGLVMIEALACGTPVIAFDCGSVPEVLEDRRTGFIVHSVPEAVRALENIKTISRSACRREFETRYTVTRMAENCLSVYQQLREDTAGFADENTVLDSQSLTP